MDVRLGEDGGSAVLHLANLALMAVAIVHLIATFGITHRVGPLVVVAPEIEGRIAALEALLVRDPEELSAAVELARLYRRAGELPWSYDALRAAERRGPNDPLWRLRLAGAYLELAKHDDGLRVIGQAQRQCTQQGCAPSVRARLGILDDVGALMRRRRIDAERDPAGLEELWREVLKPVGALAPRTAMPDVAGDRAERRKQPSGRPMAVGGRDD